MLQLVAVWTGMRCQDELQFRRCLVFSGHVFNNCQKTPQPLVQCWRRAAEGATETTLRRVFDLSSKLFVKHFGAPAHLSLEGAGVPLSNEAVIVNLYVYRWCATARTVPKHGNSLHFNQLLALQERILGTSFVHVSSWSAYIVNKYCTALYIQAAYLWEVFNIADDGRVLFYLR